MDTELLNVDDVARILRCAPRTVRHYVARGMLRPIRVGPRFIRFTRAEVDRFISGAPAEPGKVTRTRRKPRKEGTDDVV